MANEPVLTSDQAEYGPGDQVTITVVWHPEVTTVTGIDQSGRDAECTFTVSAIGLTADPPREFVKTGETVITGDTRTAVFTTTA